MDRSIELFWRKGYVDTSLHDLEKATGVNKSGLYSEFRDKEDLFVKSLARYAETNGVAKILDQRPYGRLNLENFLTAGQQCTGPKGCFIANSLRECSILPEAAAHVIFEHMSTIKKLVVKNLNSCGVSQRQDLIADQIITYNTGIAMRLNICEMPKLSKMVKHFLDSVLSPTN